MDKELILKKVILDVQEECKKADGAHDWHHIQRVWKNAKLIAQEEECNKFVVELSALLHDVGDYKLSENGEEQEEEKVSEILKKLNLDEEITKQVIHIVKYVSFKGGKNSAPYRTIELDIVQDADRLDAIGAIGIARAFAYGGHKKSVLHDPEISPRKEMTKEEYKNSNPTIINHFYEKLLLLKDRMNTKTGKKLAEQRHKVMEEFLEEFYNEWGGKS